jgi:hypothetical protein
MSTSESATHVQVNENVEVAEVEMTENVEVTEAVEVAEMAENIELAEVTENIELAEVVETTPAAIPEALEGGAKTRAKVSKKKNAKKDLKRFVVVSNLPTKRKDMARTDYVFINSQPRGAALKAANRGVKKIYLYETHTDKVHVFNGSTKRIATSDKAPEWVERPTHEVPVVSKLKIHRVEFPALEAKKKREKGVTTKKKTTKKKTTKKKTTKKKTAKKKTTKKKAPKKKRKATEKKVSKKKNKK